MNNKGGVSTKVESTNGIAIITERAMYWDAGGVTWAGGHCSTGVTNSPVTWYLAEGSTSGFDTWILVQNPNDTDASIKLTYMDNDGNTEEEETTVAAHSRFTRRINDISAMNNKGGVSTKVESTNSVGIIAERAMYWDAGGVAWAGGHCSTGTKRKAVKVSCLGDSVTNGNPYQGTENTYPAQMDALLTAEYGPGSYTVVNHGHGGYTADQVLADLQDLDWMAEDPDIVLLLVGGNDMNQITEVSEVADTIDATVSEVQDIIDTVKAHTNADGSTPELIVSTFIPNLISGPLGTLVIIAYNNDLKNDLTGMDMLIETNWEDFYDSGTIAAKTSLMVNSDSDKVHPNAAGYGVMAENWRQAINSVLGDPPDI